MNDLITSNDIAKEKNCDPSTVVKWARKNNISFVKKEGRKFFFDKSKFNSFNPKILKEISFKNKTQQFQTIVVEEENKSKISAIFLKITKDQLKELLLDL